MGSENLEGGILGWGPWYRSRCMSSCNSEGMGCGVGEGVEGIVGFCIGCVGCIRRVEMRQAVRDISGTSYKSSHKGIGCGDLSGCSNVVVIWFFVVWEDEPFKPCIAKP
jgi:hypothetical protein